MPLPAAVRSHPDKPAHIMGNGEMVSYAELDSRSRRLSQLLAQGGIRAGDRVAVLMENHIRFPEVYWGIIRTGCLLTPINRHLTADEIAYILDDSGAKALITTVAMSATASRLVDEAPECRLRLMIGGEAPGYAVYEEKLEAQPAETVAVVEPQGDFMNYSSGTTGRPKGVRRAIRALTLEDPSTTEALFAKLLRVSADTVYLSTAPLYHSAPLVIAMMVQAVGGTVVLMERFDPKLALSLIEREAVTHSQWVPTMFVRLLRLPEHERTSYDLSSHRVAVHAAAPCAPHVKRAMLDWWGPIIDEYYGGTELNGLTFITSQEWLSHPGSVGRAVVGIIHICDDDGRELPAGEVGRVYFERDQLPFEYHNDPAKTKQAQHPCEPTWTQIGDIGYVDDDGFLYLTDRSSFTIISGGINVYPREIEEILSEHPAVADVAVIGVPDEEMGERVLAVVEPESGVEPSQELIDRLMSLARSRLAGFKTPRDVVFVDRLPRLETGKLYKAALRERYGGGSTS